MDMSKKFPNEEKHTIVELERECDRLDREVNEVLDPLITGETLKELIEEAGYTQEEVATLLRMDRKSVQNYCNGSQYSIYTLVRLSRIFDCSVDYLLGLSECRKVDNHSVSEETGLADGSIERLKMAHQYGDVNLTWMYDYLIQNDNLVSALKNYYYLHTMTEEEVDRALLTDPKTNTPIETAQINNRRLNVPNLKMIYANNAILSLFEELEYYGENRSWKHEK